MLIIYVALAVFLQQVISNLPRLYPFLSAPWRLTSPKLGGRMFVQSLIVRTRLLWMVSQVAFNINIYCPLCRSISGITCCFPSARTTSHTTGFGDKFLKSGVPDMCPVVLVIDSDEGYLYFISRLAHSIKSFSNSEGSCSLDAAMKDKFSQITAKKELSIYDIHVNSLFVLQHIG